MIVNGKRRSAKHAWASLSALLLGSCSRAPSVDVLGSFFPAWLLCSVIAVLLTILVRILLQRYRVKVAVPVLVYPSLAASFTFLLWLIFFY
jgi:YtcA family